MKLTAPELAHVCAQGLHITEKCNGCGKLLNQIFRYTIARKSEVLFCRVPGPGVLRRRPGSQEEINALEVYLLRGNAGREKPRRHLLQQQMSDARKPQSERGSFRNSEL